MRLGTAIAFGSGFTVFAWTLTPIPTEAQSSLLSGMSQEWNQCDKLAGAYLVGCHPPTDDPCDPTYAGYHVNQTTAAIARQQCAEERQQQQQQQQTEIEQQHRQAAAQEAARRDLFEQQKAVAKAVTQGYRLIPTVKDLILDGKPLAKTGAKIQISGRYKKVGDSERLYGSLPDAIQSDDNYVSLLTDDAERSFREYLLNPLCQAQFGAQVGCPIAVGGHVTMCHRLAAEFANYPAEPCLSVEIEIKYRPGD